MNISQRQATIFVLGFQLIVLIILWLSQLFAKQNDDLLTVGAGIAMLMYGGMLFAYLRSWEYARHASVALITLIVATFLPEPFVTTYAPFLILLGPILALVLINPYWVIGSAVVTIGLLLVRAGGVGVYANPTTLLNYAMLIAGLAVSRVITETAHTRAEKTEEALHDSQARMASIINSAMDAMISIDNSQRIMLFNPAAERMFGYTTDEIMGKLLDVLIPELYRAKHQKQVESFGQTGITNRHMSGYLEVMGVKKNGDEFSIDASISQIHIKEGKLFTAILRDITQRKQAESDLQKIYDELELQFQQRTVALSQTTALLETMLEYVPDQIYFKDANSRFIKNSKAQAKALGLSDPSLIAGKTDFDFFPHAQRSFDEEQEIIRTGKSLVDFEERVVWPDGKETWVSTTKVPLRNHDGQISGTFGISRDITERKRAEESLRKAKDELEARVAEQTAELREANEQLQLELSERKQTEEALMHSQARVTGIINSAMDAIISIDISQHIVFFNPAAEVMFGCDQAFALGQPIENFLPERFRASHSQHIQHFSDTGVTSRAMGKLGTIYGLRFNGEEFPIEASISQTRATGHELYTVILRDVTERKKAEDRQKFLASASRALAASLDYETTLTTVAQLAVPKIADWCTVYLVASDGSIEQVALTHAKPEKIKWARELQQRYPPNPNAPRGVAQVIRSGQAEFMSEIPAEMLEPLKKDPEMSKLLDELQLTGSMTVPLTSHGQILGAISLVSAESRIHFTSFDLELAEELARRVALALENVRLYRNAQQLNETLEQRIAERTAQLEAANKELEAFSYSVSHDLRSPLRGIDGWSLALLEDYGGLLDEQGQAHIQRVRAETQRMGELIDDLLKLSRITRSEMNKKKVNLSAIAETVTARLQGTKPKDRQVEFSIQKGLTAMCDPKLLAVVLTNLLDNAFKFTSKKKDAHIEFGQTVIQGDRAFFVRDNGAGFDMNYANKLFGAFQRMHRTSEFPGTGVGLATVQRIIHRHGGNIWASSEVDQGATFYFTLEDNQ